MTATTPHSPIELCSKTLNELNHSIARPGYDRARLEPRLVHIGAGAFNRSHLAVYLDDLLAMDGEPRWAEVGVGLLEGDRALNRALKAQNGLYSLMQLDAGQAQLRVVGSLAQHLFAPEATEAVLGRMSAPECAIVSLTVTEGGYFQRDGGEGFDAEHAAVRRDLENPTEPRTWLGFVAEAARRRRDLGRGPFTLMSCDNVQANGAVAKRALLGFAALREDALAQWIERNVSFPSSMVDRITPRTTDENSARIATEFGVLDAAAVVCEPFRQWVLEDEFIAGRPAFEHVGAEMTTDVAPYEKMKMRLLNGGHSTLGYMADLLGIGLIHDAAADSQLAALLAAYMREVMPVVPRVKGVDLDDYARTVAHRFRNPAIADQTARICSEGSTKVAKFLVPPLRELLVAGADAPVLALVVAGWLDYQQGLDEQGRALRMADSQAALLREFVASGCRDAQLALQQTAIFGTLAQEFPTWAARVQQNLDQLRASGVRATVARVLSDQ